MRVLVIDVELQGLDFCLRAIADGHEVRWFRPTHRPLGEGFPGLKIVPDWRDSMAWVGKAGLVVLTGNAKWLSELDRYRDLGFRIFGPTRQSAALEIDRAKGMEVMKAVGIDLPHYECFDSLEAAEAFARKADQPYVFKPLGDTDDKALTYCSHSPADMVGWIQRQRARGMVLKGPCMLQEKIDMAGEIGISGWFGPEGFLPGKYQWAFEHKALMNDEKGPACFTPDAEVLTKTGWKLWPEVAADDEICTLIDGEIAYEKPKRIVAEPFRGDLVGWSNRYADILVTPGHNMYVQDDHYRRPFFFESAEITASKIRTFMRGGGVWKGSNQGVAPERAALIGMYIADGNCKKRSLVFGNCPHHKQATFSEIAAAAGYRAEMYGRDLYINSVALADSLRGLGLAHEKRVPQEIKDSTPEVISGFLRGYGAGDGSSRNTNQTYTTVSKGLADDLQELALKVGWAAGINTRDRRGETHEIKGYQCVNQRIAYEIGISQEKQKAELRPDFCRREHYDGMVYCVEVTSHVIYTRRNGKPCWIGQTGEQGTLCAYVESDPFADDYLLPFAPILQALGHRGDFSIGCGVDKAGKVWPFEFTSRAGWPAWFIQTASHKGDCVQWMSDLMDGKDSLKVDDRPAIGVLMTQPPFPQWNGKDECVVGNPIEGLDEVWDQVHPCMMMLGRGPYMDDDKIKTGPVYQTAGEEPLVVTGLGATVMDARAAVYEAVDSIKFPDRQYRTDIGLKVKSLLPLLHKHGYAESIAFGED